MVHSLSAIFRTRRCRGLLNGVKARALSIFKIVRHELRRKITSRQKHTPWVIIGSVQSNIAAPTGVLAARSEACRAHWGVAEMEAPLCPRWQRHPHFSPVSFTGP